MSQLRLRPAEPSDAELLLHFIRELARIEAFPFPVTVTAQDLLDNLFGPRPAGEALLGFVEDEPACFAVFYETFSTTTGKRGLHLDDLCVLEQFQGRGYGDAMLARVAGIARARGCARFEWWALRTNARAIRFFEAKGARQMEELVIFRTQGESLARLVRSDS